MLSKEERLKRLKESEESDRHLEYWKRHAEKMHDRFKLLIENENLSSIQKPLIEELIRRYSKISKIKEYKNFDNSLTVYDLFNDIEKNRLLLFIKVVQNCDIGRFLKSTFYTDFEKEYLLFNLNEIIKITGKLKFADHFILVNGPESLIRWVEEDLSKQKKMKKYLN